MISYAQAQTDFQRQITYGGAAVCDVTYGSATKKGLKSAMRFTTNSEMFGEVDVVGMSVRMLGNAFNPMPKDNDFVTVDGIVRQVAEVRYTASEATCRMMLLDAKN
jgi:hypothetical protein